MHKQYNVINLVGNGNYNTIKPHLYNYLLNKSVSQRSYSIMKLIKMFTVLIMAIFTAFPVVAVETATPVEKEAPRVFSGTVEIDSTQMAFIISGQRGSGVLEFEGDEHQFSIGGLGIGGVGVQKINAVGVVYNLSNLSDFNGIYSQIRMGVTVGKGKGQMALSNSKNVIMELKTSMVGAALSLGFDGMSVQLK